MVFPNIIPSSHRALPDHLSNDGFKAPISMVFGETSCGFMTSSYIPPKENRKVYHETMSEMHVNSFLKFVVPNMCDVGTTLNQDFSDHATSISFANLLDDETLTFLLKNGLRQRCPEICPEFDDRREAIGQARNHAINEGHSKLYHDLEAFRRGCMFSATAFLQKQVSLMYP